MNNVLHFSAFLVGIWNIFGNLFLYFISTCTSANQFRNLIHMFSLIPIPNGSSHKHALWKALFTDYTGLIVVLRKIYKIQFSKFFRFVVQSETDGTCAIVNGTKVNNCFFNFLKFQGRVSWENECSMVAECVRSLCMFSEQSRLRGVLKFIVLTLCVDTEKEVSVLNDDQQ